MAYLPTTFCRYYIFCICFCACVQTGRLLLLAGQGSILQNMWGSHVASDNNCIGHAFFFKNCCAATPPQGLTSMGSRLGVVTPICKASIQAATKRYVGLAARQSCCKSAVTNYYCTAIARASTKKTTASGVSD